MTDLTLYITGERRCYRLPTVRRDFLVGRVSTIIDISSIRNGCQDKAL